MRLLVLAVLLLSCAGDEPRRGSEARPAAPPAVTVAAGELAAPPAPAPPADPRTATRQAAHDVLAEHCGECHEGHRSTNAKALAVFDLDQPDWPGRFDEHRFDAAARRLSSKPETARAAFLAFRDAELAAGAAPARTH
jgi:mono/diheme cytochrome c family protein